MTVQPKGAVPEDPVELHAEAFPQVSLGDFEYLPVPAHAGRQGPVDCIVPGAEISGFHDEIVGQVHLLPVIIGVFHLGNTLITALQPFGSLEAIPMDSVEVD